MCPDTGRSCRRASRTDRRRTPDRQGGTNRFISGSRAASSAPPSPAGPAKPTASKGTAVRPGARDTAPRRRSAARDGSSAAASAHPPRTAGRRPPPVGKQLRRLGHPRRYGVRRRPVTELRLCGSRRGCCSRDVVVLRFLIRRSLLSLLRAPTCPSLVRGGDVGDGVWRVGLRGQCPPHIEQAPSATKVGPGRRAFCRHDHVRGDRRPPVALQLDAQTAPTAFPSL
jgi:hypothetical protein